MMMGRRNRYFEGMEDGQMTPLRYPNFNSYVKNLRVLVFLTDGRTDGRMDGRTDGRMGGWMDRTTDRQRNTPTARELEELFAAVLERFLKPIQDLRVYCKN
jgi:hypothetical protein